MQQSAGILLYRVEKQKAEFFLVHPGGPFFAKKHEGFWTIPKGEFSEEEDPLSAAIREFEEETGHSPHGNFIPLKPIIQKGGKKVYTWLLEGNIESDKIHSNTFSLIWPPKSGKTQLFPEIDKAGWFSADTCKTLINERQIPLITEALSIIYSDERA